jgi:hypothetical protein
MRAADGMKRRTHHQGWDPLSWDLLDTPTQVSLTVLPVTETRGIILTYWGSPDGAKANIKDLTTIITSLKGIK